MLFEWNLCNFERNSSFRWIFLSFSYTNFRKLVTNWTFLKKILTIFLGNCEFFLTQIFETVKKFIILMTIWPYSLEMWHLISAIGGCITLLLPYNPYHNQVNSTMLHNKLNVISRLQDMIKYDIILYIGSLKGILCDFFIFTLEQIIVLNKYCTFSQNVTCHNTTELVLV